LLELGTNEHRFGRKHITKVGAVYISLSC